MPYSPYGDFYFAPELVNADIEVVREKLGEAMSHAYGNMDSANYRLWWLCERNPDLRTSVMRVLFSTNVVRYLSVMSPRPLGRDDYFPEANKKK